MDYPIKKVAMTGGSGPVGLALIRKLINERIEILLFQRADSLKAIYLPQHELLHIEYCKLNELETFIPKENDYDVFFHMGWENTDACYRNDISKHIKNVQYACDAVKLAHRLGCHTFIGVGSQAEYGRHDVALTGQTVCRPENAYGVMKLSACHATRLVCEKCDMRYLWTRIMSAYGIYDNVSSVLISTILNAMDGKELYFSKCEQIWDFVYVDDVANALYLMAVRGKHGEIYPLGSGAARPLKEYIYTLCSKLEKLDSMRFGKLEYSQHQIMHLEADIHQLEVDTQWYPQIDFDTGIEKTIDFYKQWKIEWEDVFWKRYEWLKTMENTTKEKA